MIVTTYTCDKCKYSQETPEQMWEVGIVVQTVDKSTLFASSPSHPDAPREKKLWCRKCVEQLDLLPIPITGKPPPAPIPETLEDKIYEIVHDAMQAEVRG